MSAIDEGAVIVCNGVDQHEIATFARSCATGDIIQADHFRDVKITRFPRKSGDRVSGSCPHCRGVWFSRGGTFHIRDRGWAPE